MIIRALLAREAGPLYLVCMNHNETYYRQFGFRRVEAVALPPALRRIYRVGRVLTATAVRSGAAARPADRHVPPGPPPESTSSGSPSAGGAA